jgi:hypothetical protein
MKVTYRHLLSKTVSIFKFGARFVFGEYREKLFKLREVAVPGAVKSMRER